jgi:hypothetical protein
VTIFGDSLPDQCQIGPLWELPGLVYINNVSYNIVRSFGTSGAWHLVLKREQHNTD